MTPMPKVDRRRQNIGYMLGFGIGLACVFVLVMGVVAQLARDGVCRYNGSWHTTHTFPIPYS